MTKEIWKDIKGYEGLYLVSSLGNVKSIKRDVILKPQIGTWGYRHVRLSKTNGKTIKTHRLVAETFIPMVNGKNQVNHKDGNKLNNNVKNLEWCDCQENTVHAFGTGLRKSKIKVKDIENIKKMYLAGVQQWKIGDIFGVTQSRISHLLSDNPIKYAN